VQNYGPSFKLVADGFWMASALDDSSSFKLVEGNESANYSCVAYPTFLCCLLLSALLFNSGVVCLFALAQQPGQRRIRTSN
jgi:hypothetical protein